MAFVSVRIRTVTPVLICLLVASMTLFYSAVQAAQTTSIYNINGPSRVVAGSETPLPVSVSVHYSNAVTGSRLIVGILTANSSPETVVPGVVVASTDPCINQPGTVAICAVTVARPYGVVKIDFQIGGIFDGREQPKLWNLNITSLLINPQNNVIPGSVSSKLFKIDLTWGASNNATVPTNKPDTLAALSQLNHSILVAIALMMIAATTIAVLLAHRTRRSTARNGPERPHRSDAKKACL
jgi:Kef-type K+ transport system membrane component KefB